MRARIISAIHSPKELEALYRENPEEFQKNFSQVFEQHPDSLILQVWHERIDFSELETIHRENSFWSFKDILIILLLSAVAGTALKLPIFIDTIDAEWFYGRNLGGIFIVSLMIYIISRRPVSGKWIFVILGIASGTLLFLNLLPSWDGPNWYEYYRTYRKFNDSIDIAKLHIPLFLWLLLGAAYTGVSWRETSRRMSFLKYNGEFIIYTTILVIGGMILSGITLTLLALIEKEFELTGWYAENVVPYGVAGIPIVATFLIENIFSKRLNIAPLIGKIFTPLFLITTIAYLAIMAVYRNNPYDDREYLISLNMLMIVVLGLLIFSIAERSPHAPIGISDYINIGLVMTTLTINLIALSAVIFRSTNDVYGFTPNRITILGMNILVTCHLLGILLHYVRFATGKDIFVKLENWVAGYLPSYAIWALGVSIALPLIFWYR